MIPIQDMLHRIQWDPEFAKGDLLVGARSAIFAEKARLPMPRITGY